MSTDRDALELQEQVENALIEKYGETPDFEQFICWSVGDIYINLTLGNEALFLYYEQC